jgi:translocation and assembly module TamB
MKIPRHHFRVSRPMRWICTFIGTIIALYLGAVTVMSTAWFRGVLRREITAKLQDLTGARVEIGELGFRPLVFQLALRRLVLHGAEGTSEAPLLSAGVIVVTVDPASPFRKKLLLHRFDLEDAEIHLRTYPDGSTNLPGPQGQGPPGSADLIDSLLDLSVGDLTVSRTAVLWNNEQITLHLSAREVAIVLLQSRLRRQYTGSVTLSSLELRDQRWALPPLTFSTRIEFSRSKLALKPLAWRTAGEPRGVWGSGSLSLDRFPSLTGEASLQARGNIDVLAQALGVTEVRGGNFDWDGHIDFSGGKLATQGRAEAREVRIQSSSFVAGPISVAAEYTATPQSVNVSKLMVSLLGGSMRGRAQVLLRRPAPRLELHAALADIDLPTVFRSVAIEQPVTSRLGVAAKVSGTVEASWLPQGKTNALSTRFSLHFEPPREPVGGLKPLSGSLAGAASLAPKLDLDLDQAEFHLPHSSLKAQGSIGSDQSNLQVQFATSNFEEERSEAELVIGASSPLPLALKSQATFAGSVRGAISSPAIIGHVKVGGFEYGGWAWDGFQGDILIAEHFTRITSGRLTAGASSLDFDVTAGLEQWEATASSPLHIVARANRTPLQGLLDALNLSYPIGGRLTGHIDLSGTESGLEGDGAIAIENGTVSAEPFDSFSSQLRVAKSVFDLTDIQVAKDHGKITGQVRYDAGRQAFSGQLHGAGFSLSDFRLPAAQGTGASQFPDWAELGGVATFDLDGGGTEQDLQLHGTLSVHRVTVNNSPIGDLTSQAEWQGSAVHFSGQLTGAEGELHWAGGIEAKGNWPIQAKGQYKGLRLESLVNRLQGARLPGLILADGSFDVSGPLVAAGFSPAPNTVSPAVVTPSSSSGRFVVHSLTDSLQVQFPSAGLAWRNAGVVDITYSGETLRVNRFRMEGPSTDFTLEGSANFGEVASLALQAHGRADASALSLIDPSIAATGRFDLDFRASGTPGQPLLYGTLTVADLNLGYTGLPFRLAGLNGEIQVEGDRVSIKTLRGAGGGGTLSVSGFATLALGGGAPHYDFRVRLDQARIEFPISFTSVLSGGLHLVGTAENGTLNGELGVGQMFVPDNFDLLAWIGRVVDTFAPHPGAPPPFGGKVRLDVQVASDPEVRIESRNLNAVLNVHTSLRGTLANPVGFGEIHIASGEAKVRGNDYKVTRGDISLTNPFRTQANVDIEATTRIQHYDLTLDASGPLENARLSYRSEPPLPTQDILSLLALGYSQAEESIGVSGTQTGFGTLGASALLSQALSSQVSGRIQRLFGVSQISIDPSVGGPAATSSPRLTLVERPVRDFTITYSTNTTNSLQRVIQVEWDLTDKMSVVGERDQNGVFGLELKFRRSFR